MSLYRYIGGYREACKLAGLPININIFGSNGYSYMSKNNDLCWSKAEVVITNYFIDNNINYKREVLYSDYTTDKRVHNKNCDWVINNTIFVEYFGMMDKEYYKSKAEIKIKICNDNNIPLISLTEKNLNNLDEIFKFVFNQQNP